MERGLTTAMIVFIAGVGYLKGLGDLERLESNSVTIQFCVIASLITGFTIYGFGFLTMRELHLDFPQRDDFAQFQMLAVADTGGAGGLLRENSHGHLSVRVGCVSVAAAAILLVWSVDPLEIVALTSRAFAAYYFLQTLLALIYNYRDSPQRSRLRRVDTCLFVALALVLAHIVAFSIPAE